MKIIWDGFDIICLIVVVICTFLFGLAWLWSIIQDKIDKHFEKKAKK